MSTQHLPFRSCPVCRSKDTRMLSLLHYALFDDLDLSGTKKLSCCRTCGMLYDDVEFSEGQLARYYRSNEHYAASDAGGTGSASDDNNRRYDRILDELHDGAGGLIVDYGCGQGGFVARCRMRGLKAAGIESSAASRKVAAASGLDVYASLEDLARDRKDHVSAVVFSHVLEHLLDPLQILQNAAGQFPDAIFYLEVPDAESYLQCDDVHWDEMYFEHFNHFRPNTLRDLAERVPLDITAAKPVSFSPELKDVGCLMLLGKVSDSGIKESAPSKADACYPLTFPSLTPDPELPEGPIAIWGISQYAMLLLGTAPDLFNRTVRLFDASPAKIGRCIRGLRVESSEGIRTLDQTVTLLIPRSKYLDRMLEEARQKNFQGLVLIA